MDYISEDLRRQLARVDELIAGALASDNHLIQEVGNYLALAHGKKLRPAIAIMAANACGRPTDDDVLRVAAAVELFHVATLLHDDVIDEAPTRRGRPSINAKWSNSVAILMADFLYAQAFDLALMTIRPQVLRVLCQVTARMCEGEMFQIEKGSQILSREDYLKIIENKTAYLFSASAGLGGMVADAALDTVTRLGGFGLNFGMAFQITDDTLDYTAQDEHWGKSVGADIANGKQTLPLIVALETASSEDREAMIALLSNGRDFTRILGHIRKYNGLESARQVARDYADRATQCLVGWPGNGHADSFRRLCDYVISRGF